MQHDRQSATFHLQSPRALAASTAEALKTEAKKFCTWTNTSGEISGDLCVACSARRQQSDLCLQARCSQTMGRASGELSAHSSGIGKTWHLHRLLTAVFKATIACKALVLKHG